MRDRLLCKVLFVLLIVTVQCRSTSGQIPAFEQLAHLYDYDKSAPLEYQQKLVDDRNGIAVYWVSFNVIKDVRSDGILVVPKDIGRGGIVWLHSGSMFQWLPDALLMARVAPFP